MSKIDFFRSTVETLSAEEFISNFEQICSKFHNELNVLSFAMIIYDESVPELKKLLRDDDLWRALDKSSEERLVVFTLRDKCEYKESHCLHLMRSFTASDSRDYGKSYSALMKKIFNDESLLVFPSVLFFQVYNGDIYDYRLIPLERGDVWQSFRRLQSLLASITEVLKNIIPECYDNQREIFKLVKDELLRQKYTMYILQGPKKISEFISIVKTLLFL